MMTSMPEEISHVFFLVRCSKISMDLGVYTLFSLFGGCCIASAHGLARPLSQEIQCKDQSLVIPRRVECTNGRIDVS